MIHIKRRRRNLREKCSTCRADRVSFVYSEPFVEAVDGTRECLVQHVRCPCGEDWLNVYGFSGEGTFE